MNSFFQAFLGPIIGAGLTSFGVWIHHALTIKPNQLKIKANLPFGVKTQLQNELDILAPVLASRAETEATSLVTGLAEKILTKV